MSFKFSVVNVARAIAIVLAAIVAMYSLFLLLVGVPGISVPETIPGAPPPSPRFVYIPYLAGRIPLVASFFIIGGLVGDVLRRKLLVISWIGLAVLLVFSVLAIFGIGFTLLIAAGALLVLLTIVTVAQRNPG